jgi:trigger factor
MIIQTVKAESLEHQFKISVPANDISEKVASWLQEKAKTFKMDGFRPGKVPMNIVKNQYEGVATEKVLDQLVNDSLRKITKDNSLSLAVDPHFSFDAYAPGQDFSFTITTESMPKVELKDFSKISLEKLVFNVSDDMLEKRLHKVAQDTFKYSEAPDSYEIKNKDFIEYSFICEIDGKKETPFTTDFDSGIVGDFYSDNFFNVSQELVGLKKGDSVRFTRVIPDNDELKPFQGKEASITVSIQKVEMAQPCGIDEGLAKEFHFETLDELKEFIRQDLEKEKQSQIFLCNKRYLLDALAKEYSFELPPTMVKNEFNIIWNQLQTELQQARENNTLDSSEDRPEEELRAEYEQLAQRRVRLGILVSTIAASNKISVSSEVLANAIINEAVKHPLNYKAVLDFYRNNEGARERVRSSLLENEVVRFVLDRVDYKEVNVTQKQLTERIQAVLPDFKSDEDEEQTSTDEKPKVKKTTATAKKEKETKSA